MSAVDMAEDAETRTERSPLLHSSSADPQSAGSSVPKAHSLEAILALMIAVFFVLLFGTGLVNLPLIRVTEDTICHNYYDRIQERGFRHSYLDKIDESLCKGDEIQYELANIQGIQATLESIPSLIFAFPFGLLADKIGRKPVLILSFLGLMLDLAWILIIIWFRQIFPLRLIWTAPLFLLIGGGTSVTLSMVYTMIADVVPDNVRANSFFYLQVASLVAELLATPISSKLMKTSPWIPIGLGFALATFGICLIAFIPETLHLKPRLTTETSSPPSPIDGDIPKPGPQNFWSAVKAHFSHTLGELAESSSMFKSLPIVLLLACFLIHGVLGRIIFFLYQYISKRFSWDLADTGYLLSFRSLLNIVLLLVILPALSRALLSRRLGFGFSSTDKDLFLARCSIIAIIFGALFIAGPSIGIVIVGLIFFTFGTGFMALCRSVITTTVEPQLMGRLFAIISVVDTAGTMISGPMVASLFKAGMRLGEPWVGLPFLGLAGLCTLVAIAVFSVRLEKRDDDDIEESQDVPGEP